MITAQDIICIPLSEEEIKDAIIKAKQNFSIAKRDNLRSRHINIQFDCLLRGYIGEYAIKKWLAECGIFLEVNNYIKDGENIDIDFLYKGKNIELKTSLVPDADVTIERSILKRDIKIIKRNESIDDLHGDIHLQVYFRQRTKAKDKWLSEAEINLDEENIDLLYHSLLARAYKDTVYFVGWIDKPYLKCQMDSLNGNDRSWTFKNSKRAFWNCKIAQSKRPAELPAFLHQL